MLQKNRGESEILEREKTSKIKDWDFPRLHTKEKGVNAKKAAQSMLNGVEKKVNAEIINGNIKCTAGAGVRVKDKATGLSGLFWIDSDTHTWEGGRYTMSLELNFKNIMDKKTE